MPRPLFILFAKAPVPGRVKTRLCPPLSATEAAGLHMALVADTGEMLLELIEQADIELSTDEPTEAWHEFPFRRSIQAAGNLGTRLLCAIELGLSSGREVVTLLGSDSPGLPPTHLLALIDSTADLTLGPTPDGGFYGIACRAFHPKMFAGVRWSSEHTLLDVAAAASACGFTVETGPAWFDIDVEADLRRMLEMPDLPGKTATWIRSYRAC